MDKEIIFKKELLGGEFLCECEGKIFIFIPEGNYLLGSFFSACEHVLLKSITKNLRAVTVDYKFEERKYMIHWLAYFDKDTSTDEIEENTIAFTEVLAMIPNITNPDVEFLVTEDYQIIPFPEKLTPLKQFIYLRKE